MSKIIYICNCCGKENIDIMLMDNVEYVDRTLHICFACRRKSDAQFIPIRDFKAIHKYDIIN